MQQETLLIVMNWYSHNVYVQFIMLQVQFWDLVSQASSIAEAWLLLIATAQEDLSRKIKHHY